MQPAPPTFLPPPPQNGYQPLSEAEIYAIKRQYLGLLPPQQIIDICLALEAHAPLHVKCSVWPYDIRAAIASIQAQKAQASQTRTSPESDVPSKSSAPSVDSLSGEKKAQSQPSSHQSTSAPAHAGPPTSIPSGQQSTASQSSIPSTAPGPHYSHHPYYHTAYPHAPYYASPHALYGYPHPYASYPQPPPMYPVNPTSHQPSLFANTPLVHPPHPAPELPPPLTSVDDLPSYEEMIVEALLDSGDPEGCAPKNLFNWMAMHYPLQTNFRPSASQALQKAYKRGRLEKGSNGKYRLNENWEGGNTSRRTTRRPQTLAQTSLPGHQTPSSSPFTRTPLVPYGTNSLQTRPPPPGQPPGYPFGYSHQGTSGSAHGVAWDGLATGSQEQAPNGIEHETGEGSDAWEAAQNILKAINFGQLYQISSEGETGETSTSGNQRGRQAASDGPDKPPLVSGVTVVEESAGSRLDDGGRPAELNTEQRAALQAQLALLAAQLAELADISGGKLPHNLEVSQRTTTMSDACAFQMLAEGSSPGDDNDGDGENEDMVEVPVPLASLAA